LTSHLYICLPILNESENILELINCLQAQSYSKFTLIACVNQPENWWDDTNKNAICEDNKECLNLLSTPQNFEIIIIDKSSKGNGFLGKKTGVGWARKLTMDRAAQLGKDNDLIISIDADTHYPANYFQSLIQIFNVNHQITAHSNPYYHPLTNNDEQNHAILRYELYMRTYAIHMLLIDNPFAFSAIGSGMATSVYQYKRLGGLSPKQSGEDFYFIQKMAKSGKLSNYNSIKIFPQARFSDRVNFGTGPAMIKGRMGDWDSYPFYPPELFHRVKNTFNSFGDLFIKDIETPMSAFLRKQLKRESIWLPLRNNFKKKELFEKACMELVDGLRILQFLKETHAVSRRNDEDEFLESLNYFAKHIPSLYTFLNEIGFSGSPLSVDNMSTFRDILTNIEYELRNMKAMH